MLRTIHLRDTQDKSTDVNSLNAYLQQLVGLPVVALRFSYGDELGLHLGEPRPYTSLKMKGRLRGTFVVGARVSRWQIRSGKDATLTFAFPDMPESEAFGNPLEVKEFAAAPPIVPGMIVLSATAASFSSYPSNPGTGLILSLAFSGDTLLQIAPVARQPLGRDDAEDLADWEVFTPYGRYLRAGPGLAWSYLPSKERPAIPEARSIDD